MSGSDPQTYNPDGSEIFPEEFRVEVYVPPYLNEGRTPPVFHMTQNDWVYGGNYPITVQLNHGTIDTMRISLVAGEYNTISGTNLILIDS